MSPAPPLTLSATLRWDVVQQLWPSDVRTVLEIGCGQGAVGARLASRVQYLGIEPDSESASVARTRVGANGGMVRTCELADLEPGSCFDVVCAFEVIEHIEDDAAALRAWAQHIRPGGWLLLSTPAFQHRFGAADAAVGHYRRYEPEGLRSLMAAAGLVSIEIRRYGGPAGYALESARNLAAARRKARADSTSMSDRSGASGRWLQPRGVAALVTPVLGKALTATQRMTPGRGPGIVARGRLAS